MNNLKIITVKDDAEIQTVAALADEIWHEHYAAILQSEQIDYMVQKFQSAAAIKNDIENKGYTYYLAYCGKNAVGYCGFCPEKDGKTVFLSKIYVKNEFRGQKIATRFLNTAIQEVKPQRLWLTVNKYNDGSVAAYKKLGFIITDSMVTDIGGGFVMDDYQMSREL